MKYRFIITIVLSVAMVAGCSKSNPHLSSMPEGYEPTTTPITFQTEWEPSSYTTKGTVKEVFTQGDKLGVFAYYLPTGVWDAATSSPNFMNNQSVTNQSDGLWSYSPQKYWPTNGQLWFYAYHPYSENIVFKSIDSKPTLNYTVSSDITKHTDLLIAKNEADKFDPKGVALTFEHALCKASVLFRNKGTNSRYFLKVNSISFGGIARNTDIDLTTFESDSYIVEGFDAINLSVENNTLVSKYIDSGDEATLTNEDEFMFLPPQVFTDKAEVEINVTLYEYLDDGTTRARYTELISLKLLEGKEIKQGANVVFVIGYSPAENEAGLTVSVVNIWPTVDNTNDI